MHMTLRIPKDSLNCAFVSGLPASAASWNQLRSCWSCESMRTPSRSKTTPISEKGGRPGMSRDYRAVAGKGKKGGKARARSKNTCARLSYAHIYGHMKTTIEIDEVKLERIMKLTGIGTMKEAVDWSL